VGITSLVVDSCWLDFRPADLAAALSQLSRLQRLKLADHKWMPAAAPAAAAAAEEHGEAGFETGGSSSDGSSSDDSSDSGTNGNGEDSSNDEGSIPSARLACVLSAVAKLPQLAHLELQGLPLQRTATVQCLAAAAALTQLTITNCSLTAAGVRALAPCISNLQVLQLDSNPGIGYAGAAAVAQLQPRKLRQLSLKGSGLDSLTAAQLLLQDGLQEEAKQSLCDCLGWSAKDVKVMKEAAGMIKGLQGKGGSRSRSNVAVHDSGQVAMIRSFNSTACSSSGSSYL
jgi:hypothetical protein